MRRMILMVLCAGMALLAGANIVVLTESPVAEFTLPDGSVLKNAYVWKRSSEGLMIIHDEGQYYLNFKTLPDDWRAAYAVMDEIGQVAAAASERDDQYLIFDVIPKLDGLDHQAVTFYKSARYHGEVDYDLLQACALRSLIDNPTKALRIFGDIERIFPDEPQIDIAALYEPCGGCDGVGLITYNCPTCSGSGTCKACGGDGELDPEFEHADPKHCTTCRGSGNCARCRGKGTVSLQCSECKGLGRKLLQDEVMAKLAAAVQRLNKFRTDFGQ